MKSSILLLFSIFTILSSAQNKTPTLEEAKVFLEKTDSVLTYVIPDSDEKYVEYVDKKIEEIIIKGSDIYKVLEFKEVLAANYGFILLDTNNLSLNEINTLRETIIYKYNFGIPFSQLSEQYSIEKSSDNSLYIGTNDFGQQFQAILDTHFSGEIFTIDPPLLQNYAVILQNTPATLKKFVVVEHAVYE